VLDYLKKQRDMYAFIHDQTLTRVRRSDARQIAETIKLPKSLKHVRGPRLLRR
jgi:alkyl sulfatase BDS1-like metallo-beta-lactamase superfamily hydrolase